MPWPHVRSNSSTPRGLRGVLAASCRARPDTGAPSCVPRASYGPCAWRTGDADGVLRRHRRGVEGRGRPLCPRRDQCPARAQAVVSFGRPRSADDTLKVIVTVHALLRVGLRPWATTRFSGDRRRPRGDRAARSRARRSKRAGAAAGLAAAAKFASCSRALAAGLEQASLSSPGPTRCARVLARGKGGTEGDGAGATSCHAHTGSRARRRRDVSVVRTRGPVARAPLRRRGRDHGAPGHGPCGCTRRPGRWSLPRAAACRPRRRERGARDASRASWWACSARRRRPTGDPARRAGHCGGRALRVDPRGATSRAWPPRGGRRSAGQADEKLLDATADPQVFEAIAARGARPRAYDGARRCGACCSTGRAPRGAGRRRGSPSVGTAGSAVRGGSARGHRRRRAPGGAVHWRTLVEHMRAARRGPRAPTRELCAMAGSCATRGDPVARVLRSDPGRDTWRDCDAYVSGRPAPEPRHLARRPSAAPRAHGPTPTRSTDDATAAEAS